MLPSDHQPNNNNTNSSANNDKALSTSATTTGSQGSNTSRITQEAIQNVAKYLPGGDTKRAEQEIVKDRKFWNHQPVPKICKYLFVLLLLLLILCNMNELIHTMR